MSTKQTCQISTLAEQQEAGTPDLQRTELIKSLSRCVQGYLRHERDVGACILGVIADMSSPNPSQAPGGNAVDCVSNRQVMSVPLAIICRGEVDLVEFPPDGRATGSESELTVAAALRPAATGTLIVDSTGSVTRIPNQQCLDKWSVL